MTDTFEDSNGMKRRQYTHILTEEYLNKEYCKKKKSISDISKETGIKHDTIADYISRYGIRRRRNNRPPHYMNYLRKKQEEKKSS